MRACIARDLPDGRLAWHTVAAAGPPTSYWLLCRGGSISFSGTCGSGSVEFSWWRCSCSRAKRKKPGMRSWSSITTGRRWRLSLDAATPVNGARQAADFRRVLAVVRHPVGGIRTHLLYTYPHLAERGYSFTFVLPAIDDTRSFRREVEALPNAEVVECADGRPADSAVRVRSHHSQVVAGKAISAHPFPGNSGGNASRLGQHRHRRAARRNVPGHGSPRGVPGAFRPFEAAALGTLLSRVDVLVTVTSDARQNHLDLFPPLRMVKRKVLSIVNGINTDLFRSDQPAADQPLRRTLGLDCNVFLAGFLGRFMEQKGFLVLVDAIEHLLKNDLPRPFHLVAVESGDFIREYQAILRTRPHVENCITFMPRQPNVADVLRQLDALVMPSLWEACGILAMEAMAVGVPVVGSNCPGLREVLEDTPSRTVPPNDPAALAQSLRQAMTAPRKQEAIAYAAEARERFDVAPYGGRPLQAFRKTGRCGEKSALDFKRRRTHSRHSAGRSREHCGCIKSV